MDIDWHQSRAEMLAVVLMMTVRIRTVARQLVDLIGPMLPLSAETTLARIRVALSLFEARRRIFRSLFCKRRVRELIVTYSPGRSGEIAAARELGIPVAEFQHGMVSAGCPDYSWPASYASLKSEMAIPDRIAMFGPIFRQQIMQSGFWDEADVPSVGSAAIDLYRPRATRQTRRPGKIRLLFMTQSTVRPTSLAFWQTFARNENSIRYEVNIKVHPEEASQAGHYCILQRTAPDRFTMLPLDINPMEAILDADIVISYNSLSLVEGLALGRPAVSLCGGSIPRGFIGSFALSDIRDVMPHVTEPEELLKLLLERAGDETALKHWQAQAAVRGFDFYAPGFVPAATQLINGMINRIAVPG